MPTLLQCRDLRRFRPLGLKTTLKIPYAANFYHKALCLSFIEKTGRCEAEVLRMVSGVDSQANLLARGKHPRADETLIL